MAKGWDKIKDKIEAGAGAPQTGDWEAMNAKIQANPALTGSSGLAIIKTWVLLSLLCVSGAAWWYVADYSNHIYQTNKKEPGQEISIPVDEKLGNQEPARMAPVTESTESGEQEVFGVDASSELIQKKEASEPKQTEKTMVVQGVEFTEEAEPSPAEERQLTTPIPEFFPAEQENAFLPEKTVLETRTSETTLNSAVQDANESTLANTNVPNPEAESSLSDSSVVKGNSDEQALSSSLAQTAENEAQASSAAAEDFYNAQSGFKIRAVQIGGKYLNNFNNQNGWQVGGDVTLNRNSWLLNTGLYYGQNQQMYEEVSFRDRLQIDSSFTQQITSRNVQEIRSYWIVDSFFAGHWENDTVVVQVTDTSKVLNIDTTRFNLREVNERTERTSYVEMPILAGYEFPINRFNFQLMGGVILNQTITAGGETGSVNRFGLSGVLQPALHYSYSPGYSVYIRSGLRYALKPNASVLPNRFVYDIQLGIAIEW